MCSRAASRDLAVEAFKGSCKLSTFDLANIPLWISDGCGMIGPELAAQVTLKLQLSSPPSAFQIRFAGFKGVVVVNRHVEGLHLRPSMNKFECAHSRTLEILNHSQSFPGYLNRQIVMILSARGVSDAVFTTLQHEHLMGLSEGRDLKLPFLPGINELPADDPFKRALIRIHYQRACRDLLTRTRIAVPRSRVLMGVVDESGELAEGQVYCHVSGQGTIEGTVLVAKNPCMHPGDLRVLEAVRCEALASLKDVLVFPRRGCRPIADMCSGSDLDGDLYFVCWDERLIPPILREEPMDYSGLPAVELSNPVSVSDVHEFVVNYMANDRLGSIANAHLVLSDRFPEGVRNAACTTLARIFSLAVDFPKTGFMAQLPSAAKIDAYPDFMGKKGHPSYASQKIIGQLYRQVLDLAHQMSDSSESIIEENSTTATGVFGTFKRGIQECCRMYGFKDEAHLWLGELDYGDQWPDLKDEMVQSAQLRLRVLIEEAKGALKRPLQLTELLEMTQGDATSFPWLFAPPIEIASSPNRIEADFASLWNAVTARSTEIVAESLDPLLTAFQVSLREFLHHRESTRKGSNLAYMNGIPKGSMSNQLSIGAPTQEPFKAITRITQICLGTDD